MQISLNSEQQKAVTHQGSPLLVIAGPGSGKTLVIVERIKHLIKTGIKSSEVLCLTFTEKASEEMKQRLEKEKIIDVTICTFHSFAKDVLDENFLDSGLGDSPGILKKPSQLVWGLRNLDEFGFENIEVANNQVSIIDALIEAISNFKEEMITPDQFQKYIDDKLKQDISDEERDYLLKHSDLNKVYKKYQEYEKEKAVIDFDDMVTKTVYMFQNKPLVLSEYQKKYKYILVDEFQDNNYAQFQIVKLLAKDGNVTVVGDNDQSVFKFQGAYIGIFEDFRKRFTNATEIELNRNYRSTKNIVKVASSLLEMDTTRRKKLLYSEEEDGEKPMVVVCTDEVAEVEYIVKTIRELIGKPIIRRDETPNSLRYRDFVILSRRKTEGEKFAKVLKSYGIPTTFIGESNIFSSAVIMDMLSYLKIANSPTGAGIDLFRLMKNHGISEQNIAIINEHARKKAHEIEDSNRDFVLDSMRQANELAVTQKAELKELVEQIDQVINLENTTTVSDLVFEVMMSISGLYKKTLQSDTLQNTKNRLLLDKLLEIARDYQILNINGTLTDFIDHLSILGKFDIELEEDVATEDTVHVMTMHKSKGKEYPVVFVTDLAEDRFPSNYKERKFHVPKDLLKGVKREIDEKGLHIEEERRLFYVAMTRAKNLLYITYPKRYQNNKNDKKPSGFLQEINYDKNPLIDWVQFEGSGKIQLQSQDIVERIKQELQDEAVRSINQMQLQSAIYRIIELARIKHYQKNGKSKEFNPQDVLKVNFSDINLAIPLGEEVKPGIKKEDLVLSPSSINTYSDCPLKFKYQKILRVPTPSSSTLDLGITIHKVVEDLAKIREKGITPTEEEAMKILSENRMFRSYQNKMEYKKSTDRIREMVKAYLEWEEKSPNKVVAKEVDFQTEVDGVQFVGRIDRVEKNPQDEYEIIDFKSGSVRKSRNTIKTDPQMNIYALGVKQLYGKLPKKASLFYLEHRTVSYDIIEEQVEEALKPIRQMIQLILDGRFEPTPSIQACMFCDYQSICDAKVTEE